jgi:hypothetical protein
MATEAPPRARLRHLSSCLTGGMTGWTLWHYLSDYTLAEVREPTFFADAERMIRAGDFLAVTASDAGGLLYVSEVGSGAVVTRLMASTLRETPMTQAEFLNLLRRLFFLDHADVPFLDDREWALFRDDPHRFFVRTDDDIAALIWAALNTNRGTINHGEATEPDGGDDGHRRGA